MRDKVKFYLNLTNGIEFLSDPDFKEDYNFIRIQSCSCERHLWDKILLDLDYNFLLDIALGYTVVICDASPHKKFSRALYQGVEFIQYTLNRVWLNKITVPYVKEMNCSKYFNNEFNILSKATIKKIKYLRKFLNTDKINIIYIGTKTEHDGNYDYFKELLVNKYKEEYYE